MSRTCYSKQDIRGRRPDQSTLRVMNEPEKPSEKGVKKLTRRSDDVRVVVTDQTRRRLKTTLGRGWDKRGSRAIAKVAEVWEATNLLGALCKNGEIRFFQSESNLNSEVRIHFLRALHEESERSSLSSWIIHRFSPQRKCENSTIRRESISASYHRILRK